MVQSLIESERDGASVQPAREETTSLTKRLWGIDWRAIGPWKLDEVTVEAVSFDVALAFMQAHYANIFQTGDGRFYEEKMTAAKRRFCAEIDSFAFRVEDRVVGIHTAHPSDWSTYYLRSAALVPEYRNRRLVDRLQAQLDEVLRAAGVARVEVECSPTNLPMTRIMTRLGYIVTSTSNTERWGCLLRWTKFLSNEAGDVFVRQFSSMSTPQPALRSDPLGRRSS